MLLSLTLVSSLLGARNAPPPWSVISTAETPVGVDRDLIGLGEGIVSDNSSSIWFADPLMACGDIRAGKSFDREKTYIGVKRDGGLIAFSDSQWPHLGLGAAERGVVSVHPARPVASPSWPTVVAFSYVLPKGSQTPVPVLSKINMIARGKHPNREFSFPGDNAASGAWFIDCRELPGGTLRFTVGYPARARPLNQFRLRFFDLLGDRLQPATFSSLNPNEKKLSRVGVNLHGGAKPTDTTRFGLSPNADRVLDCYPSLAWFDVKTSKYHSLYSKLGNQYQLGFLGSHLVAWTPSNPPNMVEVVGDRTINLGPYKLLARNASNTMAVIEDFGSRPGTYLVRSR